MKRLVMWLSMGAGFVTYAALVSHNWGNAFDAFYWTGIAFGIQALDERFA